MSNVEMMEKVQTVIEDMINPALAMHGGFVELVDVDSGVEAAPGRKDPLLLRNFISNARQAMVEVAARDPLEDPVAEEPYDWRDA